MSRAFERIDWYSDEIATFGDRVAAAREALGMSQDELARRLGIKVKTVCGWEEDLSEPRANKLQMLAGVLNVSFRWLLTGEGDGLSVPGGATIPSEVAEILTEIRGVRSQMARAAEHLGRLEKQLQVVLRDPAE